MNKKIHDAFDSVHAEEELKQNTLAYISERTRTNNRGIRFRQMAAVFACLAIVLIGAGGWNLYMTPVSIISVDINPSVELGINRFDRVVSVESYNDDGAIVLSSVNLKNLKNLKYTEALDVLFGSEVLASYVKDDSVVSFTVVSSTDQKEDEMLSRISSCHYAESSSVECCHGDHETVDEAHNEGLSVGKYRAYLELKALDPEITAEDIQGWTMRQIRDRIEELLSGSDASQTEETDCQNENSGQYGNHGQNGNCSGDGNGSGNGNYGQNGNCSGDGNGSGNGNYGQNGNCSEDGNGSGNGNHGHNGNHSQNGSHGNSDSCD